MDELKEIVLGSSLERVTTINKATARWLFLEVATKRLKRLKEQSHLEIMELMDEDEVKEIEFAKGHKIIKTLKKTQRYETQEIYKVMNFTEHQIEVLPKNPSFRKSAVLANEDICHLHCEEETDVLKLVEINENFLPPKGGK